MMASMLRWTARLLVSAALLGSVLVAPTPVRAGVGGGASIAARRTDPVIVAAGDIACDPANPYFDGGSRSWCRASKTAAAIGHVSPDAVLPLGDGQYTTGTLRRYRVSYAKSWGAYRPETYPAPGNHDYESSPTARGYRAYFGARAVPPGGASGLYYSYNLGTWHLISLNSNCTFVRCGPGSAQYRWLQHDLNANPSSCTLAYWHAPRRSSGPHGADRLVQPFWHLLYRSGADVVLNGHDHIYERFAPLDASGSKDAASGIRAFTVGTGGEQHYRIATVQPHSVVRNTTTFGVLKLTLHKGGYRWQFVPVAGASFSDSGTGVCHGPPA